MKRKEVGFYITRGTGFHIMFENGYVVSVQFSPDSYCDNSCKEIPQYDRNSIVYCPNAEVAVWNEETVGERGYPELIEMPNFDGDTVGAYFTPKEVLGLLCWAASQVPTENSQNNSNPSPNEEK